MTEEELQDVETGCLVRHEPAGLFYLVVDKSERYPRVINSQTMLRPEDWKLVRRAGEVVEGWNEI